MSLENVKQIQYIDISPDKSFLPYVGLEREQAREIARDFARLQEEIFAAARKKPGDKAVNWSPDHNWLYFNGSNDEMVSRDGNKFTLTLADFARKIADGLGIDSDCYLGVDGAKYFFDAQGNFGKVIGLDYYEPDCIEAMHSPMGRPFYYRKEQMQGGDFEFVGYVLSSMRAGVEAFVPKSS